MKKILVFLFALAFCINQAESKEKAISVERINAFIEQCKQFNMEKITLQSDTLRADYCLNPECSTFITWVFSLQNIKTIELRHEDENYFLHFECKEENCIVPPVIGTIYSPKSEYDMYIKSKTEASTLLDMLLNYQQNIRK